MREFRYCVSCQNISNSEEYPQLRYTFFQKFSNFLAFLQFLLKNHFDFPRTPEEVPSTKNDVPARLDLMSCGRRIICQITLKRRLGHVGQFGGVTSSTPKYEGAPSQFSQPLQTRKLDFLSEKKLAM